MGVVLADTCTNIERTLNKCNAKTLVCSQMTTHNWRLKTIDSDHGSSSTEEQCVYRLEAVRLALFWSRQEQDEDRGQRSLVRSFASQTVPALNTRVPLQTGLAHLGFSHWEHHISYRHGDSHGYFCPLFAFRDIISYGDYDCLLDALCQPEFMSNIYLSIVRARHISPKRWMLNLQLFQGNHEIHVGELSSNSPRFDWIACGSLHQESDSIGWYLRGLIQPVTYPRNIPGNIMHYSMQ